MSLLSLDPGEQPGSGAAQRRKQRRLRSWWRHEQQSIAAALATFSHHSALRGQKKARGGEEESELHCTAEVWKTPPPQPVLFSLYEEELGGGLPAWKSRWDHRNWFRSAPWSPQRAVLRVPQMAEQLDEPVPSFDDSELVEEEEEEEEQPRFVPESYFRDTAGREWCRRRSTGG